MEAPRQGVRGTDRWRRLVGGLSEAEALRWVAVIAFEQGQIEVHRDAGRLEQGDLRAGGVELPSRSQRVVGRILHLAERDDVLGERQDRRRVLELACGRRQVTITDREPAEPGERWGRVRLQIERGLVGGAGSDRIASETLEMPADRPRERRVLRCDPWRPERATHRVERTVDVATQLTCVRESRQRREIGGLAGERFGRVERLVVAAELDERIDDDRARTARLGREPDRCPPRLEGLGEPVSTELEPSETDKRLRVLRK